ncbi:MAG: 13E12 repeat family protein [Actinomycetota bacterium]|nr:13E12 repeat family protein [Actinomycetota bacterium]
MFDTVLDALAQATGCDRSKLGALVGEVPHSEDLTAAQLCNRIAAQLCNRIAAQERLSHAVQATQLCDTIAFTTVRHADDVQQQVPDHLHGRTAATELAFAMVITPTSARFRIHDATRAMADHPALLSLVGTGSVSMTGLRGVLYATEVLDPDLRRAVDGQLAADAMTSRLTPGRLAQAAERRVLAADPLAADKRAERARLRRSVRLSDPIDGTAAVLARLRAEEALAVFTRLDRTARGMRRDGDERSIDDLMADVLVESLLGVPLVGGKSAASPATWQSVDGQEQWWWSAPPPTPDAEPGLDDPAWDDFCALDQPMDLPGDHPFGVSQPPAHAPPARSPRLPLAAEVQVVISAATLLGLDDQPGMLRGYGAVPVSVIRDIVPSAQAGGAPTTLRALLCDPFDGRLLAMDSNARLFTGDLRNFAMWRDQGCRVSGGQVVDIDHIREHRHGGQTAAANGQSLSKLAHVLKDHPGVNVTALPPLTVGDGLDHLRVHAPDVEWRWPSGHTHRCQPPAALGPGSRPHPPRSDSVGERHLAALLSRAG